MPIYTIYEFGQAVLELQLRLGGRNESSNGVPFTSRCANWLNSAQLMLAQSPLAQSDLDGAVATLNLIQGVNEYNRNSTIPDMTAMVGIQIVQVVDNSVVPPLKQRMRRMPWREYIALSQLPSIKPTMWTRNGNTIAFNGIPDKDVYQVNFWYRSKPLLNTVSIEAGYQEQWINLAKYLAWESLDQPQKAQAALLELPAQLQTIVQSPLDEEQWESANDPDQVIAPEGFTRGWHYLT